MSSINSLLKEAREAIKKKDYNAVLKLCKVILKEDKENYMGLVFLGISFQELGQTEQAPKAFRKAIGKDSSNLLAWNGLANFYEKTETPDRPEQLVDIYCNLIKLQTEEGKQLEIWKKVILLPVQEHAVQKVLDIVFNLAKTECKTNQFATMYFNYILTLVGMMKDTFNDNLIIQFDEFFLNLKTNSVHLTKEQFLEYIKLLDDKKYHEKVLVLSLEMHAIRDQNQTCLELICKSFAMLFAKDHTMAEKFPELEKKCDFLLVMAPKSVNGFFAKGCFKLAKGEISSAKQYFQSVVTTQVSLTQCWELLFSCLYQLELYDDASTLIQRYFEETSFHSSLNELSILLLSRSSKREMWDLAVKLYNMSNKNCSYKIRGAIANCFANLENFAEAEKLLEDLKSENFEEYCLSQAFLFTKQWDSEQAESLLKENVFENNVDYWILLGDILLSGNRHKEALVSLLKAAKINPNSYKCFLNLGQYYQKYSDFEKARRCYEKSFRLNNKCQEAGVELSKIYRKLKSWDANLTLLQDLTSGKINSNNQWAYLQLGLHYLENEEYTKAIDTLQFLIRHEPDNCNYWESLADAYMLRGAYTAALKCYQKALEIESTSLYALLQIAEVKKTMHQFIEAKEDFESILRSNQKYVPALKGIAETCLNLAYYYRRRQLLGRCKEYAQEALKYAIIALGERGSISCLWKIVADCCKFAANLPEKYSELSIDAKVIEGKDVTSSKFVQNNELFELAERFYCKAISLVEDNVLIWHDLSATYYAHSKKIDDNIEKNELLAKAMSCIKHCIGVSSASWQHWNLMGIIAFYSEEKNYALSQHAFIKAVTLEPNSAMAWSNLGILYMHLNDIRLANKSFSNAQRADPNYANSWIGQALIAEVCEYSDAMDLYRNSTQLTHVQEGAIGYGYYVCKTLLENPPDAVLYSIKNMHAIPVALDSMTWYTENDPDNSCAWNMLGILNERMGLKETTRKAYRMALSLVADEKSRDKVFANYGRSLVKLGSYSEAVDMFKSIQDPHFNHITGLALAYFKNEQFEESYEAYEAALHMTEKEIFQSDLLVALASMAYLFQGTDEAKTLLFQSTQLTPRSPWGLYATLSLGLLHEDLNLANLVLKEFKKLQENRESHPHVALLTCLTYLMQDKFDLAKKEISRMIIKYPGDGSLWLNLSTLLLRSEDQEHYSNSAKNCSERAMHLGKSKMDISKMLCVTSLASYINGNYKEALRSAQIAIHTYPNIPDSWVMLISTLTKLCKSINVNEKVSFIRDNLKPAKQLSEWLNKLSVMNF